MNPEHVAVVRQGREAINTWRRGHPDQRLDLIEAYLTVADLARADLFGANLGLANLGLANLAGANLTGAHLLRADLTVANLSGANLSGANLSGADLIAANLAGADLTGASLLLTRIQGAKLGGVQFGGARFDGTVISLCDLSVARGLESAIHERPSSIGVDTLMWTFRGAGNQWTPELRKFFANAGIAQELLDQLPGIIAEVKYYSCFIAYGEPDRDFAERLYQDLGARGISRWMYAMDSTPGERTQREIGLKRREAEKFIVLCSAQGLVRDGVKKEIEEQMDEDPDKIIPISLDEMWKHSGFQVVRSGRDLKPFLLERNYADFGQGRDYAQGFQRLLRALQRKDT
jgi:hypothetical protein